jgi:cAMP-dependent protein kinase regulator
VHDTIFNFFQVLKDCIVQVCVTRPDNPIAYLREYFQKLERQIAQGSKAGPLSPDDAEEAESPIPPVQSQQSVRRRGAISAEPITEEDASSYVKKVVCRCFT